MSSQHPTTIARLLERMEASRAALETVIRSIDRAVLTQPGADGWSVKDHLAHLAAWENSIVALLQGIGRHVGLSIDQQLYEAGPEDRINAAIKENAQSLSFEQVLERHRAVHSELCGILSRLTDADLSRGYSSFLPEEPGEDSGRPIVDWIAGNTFGHFDEHAAWIGDLVKQRRS